MYKLLDNLEEGVYILNTERKIIYWNKSAEKITGYKGEEIIGMSCRDNILKHTDKDGKNLCKDACPIAIAMKENVNVEGKVYLHHKSGYRLMVHIKGIPIIKNNKVIGCIELFSPHLPLSNYEKDLLILAFKDSLTNLYNRKGFDFIYPMRQQEIAVLGYKTACLFFDVDDFKKINDTYGHNVGDKVLVAVAKTFHNILRHYDIAVRWGGEEFLLVIFIKDVKYINTIGNRLINIMGSTFIEYKGEIVRFTISGGGTVLTKEESILDAVNRSDTLMYEAKKQGKNRFISDI